MNNCPTTNQPCRYAPPEKGFSELVPYPELYERCNTLPTQLIGACGVRDIYIQNLDEAHAQLQGVQ